MLAGKWLPRRAFASALLRVAAALCVLLPARAPVHSQVAEPFRTPPGVEVELPITSTRLDRALARIAEQGRRPFGVELAEFDVAERDDQRGAEYVLDLAGLTWRETFDLLAKHGARYEIAQQTPVVVVRPQGAAGDRQSVLNRGLPEFTVDSARIDDALFMLLSAIDRGFRRPSRRPSPTQLQRKMPARYSEIEAALDKRITLNLFNPSVIAVLNKMVEQHGEVWWRVKRRHSATSFEIRGFNGWGFGVDLKMPDTPQ